jgi:hypothetical protein
LEHGAPPIWLGLIYKLGIEPTIYNAVLKKIEKNKQMSHIHSLSERERERERSTNSIRRNKICKIVYISRV